MIFLERVERIVKWLAKVPSVPMSTEAHKAEATAKQEEVAIQQQGLRTKGRQGMPAQESNQAHPLGPTEELLAKAQAEAIASNQQPEVARLNAEAQSLEPTALETALAQEKQQAEEQERRAQEAEAQREWAAKREAQGQEQTPGWLEAPQNEGINAYPTPDANPASPGKEQHQQTLAEEAGEQSGGMKKTISTKTQLGAVVTLDGVYVVPRYQTVIKETPITEKGEDGKEKVSILKQLAKEQSSGRHQEREQNKDRDRGMER